MTLRAILLHLRLPFSLVLMPVFWFAVSQVAHPDWGRVVVVGLVLHGLLYPASHAFNSYYDKDEGPVGGLAMPPPVDRSLLRTAWWLDAVALLMGVWVGWPFVAYLLTYGFVSKAYSYDRIRLKKYPIISWLTIGLFQGGLTYVATYQAVGQAGGGDLLAGHTLLAALLSTLNLLAIYPITQVYQHKEDARRGDRTISLVMGVRGTFLATLALFGLAMPGFYVYFAGGVPFYWLTVAMLPAVVFFGFWYGRVRRQATAANFRSTMYMIGLAGLGLNLFFIGLTFLVTT
jgi:UbiA prenyltransferase family